VEGVLFEVTAEEILKADAYEVDEYKRIETVFRSGKTGFIYIQK
jgi:predicted SnoaL-like aldol condensation-catalyzing enzyme